ncbi:MAG: FHA domain-containing protein [Candidatus Binataceae bacterium]
MAEPPRLLAVGGTRPSQWAISKSESTIGSAAGNDLVISDSTVSRRHALITRRGGLVQIIDTNSSNGTFVNGRRVAAPVDLKNGDEIRLGNARFTVTGIIFDGPASGNTRSPRASGNRTPRFPIILCGLIVLVAVGFVAMRFAGLKYSTTASKPPGAPVVPAPRSGVTANHAAKSAAARPVANPSAQGSSEANPVEAAVVAAINGYRELSHLRPVSIDAGLNDGVKKHVRYLLGNYLPDLQKTLNIGAAMHTEDPDKPYYTAAGNAAGRQSDIDFVIGPPGFRPASSTWALEDWMAGPFHRLPILNPDLARIGYAELCQENVCGAVINVLADAAPFSVFPTPYPVPIEFPANGSVTNLGKLVDEWPNPLASCPGYGASSGVPITLAIGTETDAHLSAFSLVSSVDSSQPLEACGFDASTYTNSDSVAQQRARNALHTFGAVVIVPHDRLTPARYEVSATVNKVVYRWSFKVK